MADELRRFPSLNFKRTQSSQHDQCWPSASVSLISSSPSLRRFPSLYSTRPSTITSVTTPTSPSLLTNDEEHDEIFTHHPSFYVKPLQPASVSLYSEVPLLDIDSIRILRVRPGPPGTPLDCELLTTSLHEYQNRYSALSYTWEHGISCVPVRINGRMFDMRRNLVDFICTLRSLHRDIKIWADAVCIDQQSPVERNHQVQLMSRIYSNAACTRSWLGTDMPALAFQMKLAREGWGPSDEHSASTTNTASEHVLLTLLNHRYWTRTWIIQEILLAKEVWVHCGREALQWADLVTMARDLANSLYPLSLRYLQLFGDSSLMHLHNLRRSRSSRGLPELLTEYANTGCEKVQDRVFGLIGLVNERDDPLYAGDISQTISRNRKEIIDYSLPLKDLFRRLMDMYPLLPARSFALPLWSALELDYCRFDTYDFCQKIRMQGFPCSMLMMSRSHSRTLTGAASTMDLDDTTREELLCLSDPYNKAEARQSRVCLAIRIRINDFQTNGPYLASACLVEPRGLALDHMGYDNLCRAFETTRVYKQPRSGDKEDIWAINLPLAALKALNAIVYPAAGQRLLDALTGDILHTGRIDDDLAEWAEATKNLALPSLNDTKKALAFEHNDDLPLKPLSEGHSLVEPKLGDMIGRRNPIELPSEGFHEDPNQNFPSMWPPYLSAPESTQERQPPHRIQRRHRFLRGLRLNGVKAMPEIHGSSGVEMADTWVT